MQPRKRLLVEERGDQEFRRRIRSGRSTVGGQAKGLVLATRLIAGRAQDHDAVCLASIERRRLRAETERDTGEEDA